MNIADFLGKDARELKELLLKDAIVGLVEGEIFRTGGSGFERINIACTRSTLEKALEQLAKVLGKRK
jgi:cystathionine beta-lyase